MVLGVGIETEGCSDVSIHVDLWATACMGSMGTGHLTGIYFLKIKVCDQWVLKN